MSFEMVCQNCGAPSSPMVGVCPFCKSAMTMREEKIAPSLTKLKDLYNKGQIDKALSLAQLI